jgi:hypothetical protein
MRFFKQETGNFNSKNYILSFFFKKKGPPPGTSSEKSDLCITPWSKGSLQGPYSGVLTVVVLTAVLTVVLTAVLKVVLTKSFSLGFEQIEVNVLNLIFLFH